MEQTPKLGLPLLQPGQALKYVTHNEALIRLDDITQLSVAARLQAPPDNPSPGDRYLITPSPEGVWIGHDDKIAQFDASGFWQYLNPQKGWRCAVHSEQRLYGYFETGWVDTADAVRQTERLGINATSDPDNRLSLRSRNSLFNEENGSHTLKINKATSADIASIQFQSGYTSHGEIGLNGDNSLGFKVSQDGTLWTEAVRIEQDTAHMRAENIYSGSIYLLDGTARDLIPPKSGGFMMIMVDDPAYPQLSHSAIVAYDVGVSPNLLLLCGGDKFSVTSNTVLDGSQGPATYSTLSALDGRLMIENRFGNHKGYRYTFLG